MAIEIAADAEVKASLPTTLLRAAEKLAWEMDLSVSEVIELALEDYIKQQASFSEERARIAKAYADYPDEDDQMWQKAALADMRQSLMEDEENS